MRAAKLGDSCDCSCRGSLHPERLAIPVDSDTGHKKSRSRAAGDRPVVRRRIEWPAWQIRRESSVHLMNLAFNIYCNLSLVKGSAPLCREATRNMPPLRRELILRTPWTQPGRQEPEDLRGKRNARPAGPGSGRRTRLWPKQCSGTPRARRRDRGHSASELPTLTGCKLGRSAHWRSTRARRTHTRRARPTLRATRSIQPIRPLPILLVHSSARSARQVATMVPPLRYIRAPPLDHHF